MFQSDQWEGEFGNEYTNRNNLSSEELDKLYNEYYGISRRKLNCEFLDNLSRDISILEVGCNIGNQLTLLKDAGFHHIYGVDVNEYAIIELRKKHPDIKAVRSDALHLPFKDNEFDLVFTAGVLIHIDPNFLGCAMEQIYRCSKKYIWAYEYYSRSCVSLKYHNNTNMLWKNDFLNLYLNLFKDLRTVKERKLAYLQNTNTDIMFLLEKIK